MKTRFFKCISCIFIISLLLCSLTNVIYAEETVTGASTPLPKNTYSFNGHSYKFFQGSVTWEEAAQFCESLGGHLATITSDEEWAFIREKAQSLGSHFWLGARDINKTGNWKWITNEPWGFTAWSDEYPNSDSDAKYLYISSTRDYKWFNWDNVFDGSSKEGFICEWEWESNERSEVLIPGDSYSFDNHHYMFFPFALKWHEAKEFCEDFGGHLATVSSEEEWLFLQEKAKANTGHFWLGATDESLEGEWKWVTGEPWSFTAWSSDYPNTNGDADYLYISSSRDYQWYNWEDTLDNTTEGFICEWDFICISENGYYENHNWTNWDTIKTESCHSAGEKKRTCNFCGEMESIVVEQLSHKYGEIEIISGSKLIPPITKERTCELCGNIEHIKDWSYVWVTVVAGIVAIGVIIGLIGYIKAFRKK